MSNAGYMRTLLSGLEDMRPETIVLIGGFISEANSDKNEGSNPAIYEQIGAIVRENELLCLRDCTQWILMPSLDDPGMIKVMPSFKLPDSLFSRMKGNGPGSIKKLMFGTNPMRISFRGKEVVFSRYDYLKKLKKNHLPKIQEI